MINLQSNVRLRVYNVFFINKKQSEMKCQRTIVRIQTVLKVDASFLLQFFFSVAFIDNNLDTECSNGFLTLVVTGWALSNAKVCPVLMALSARTNFSSRFCSSLCDQICFSEHWTSKSSHLFHQWRQRGQHSLQTYYQLAKNAQKIIIFK